MSNEERWLIERTDEYQAIEDFLQNSNPNLQTLVFYGVAGAGKTVLLRQSLRLADKLSYISCKEIIDLYFTDNHAIDGLMKSIASELSRVLDPDIFKKYWTTEQEFSAAKGKDTISIDILAALSRRLQKEFRECLTEATTQKQIVIGLDTLEHVENSPVGRWLFNPRQGLLTRGVKCVIAGRHEQTWVRHDDLILQRPISKLNDKQATNFYVRFNAKRDYFNRNLTSDDLATDEIRRVGFLNSLADGNPLMLGLALLVIDESPTWLLDGSQDDKKDVSREKITESLKTINIDQFEYNSVSWLRTSEYAGPVFLRCSKELQEPIRQSIIIMSYLNRRFNKTLLELLVKHKYIWLGTATLEQVWEHLQKREPDLFFVKGRSQDEIQLHEKFAELVRNYIFLDHFLADDLTGGLIRKFSEDVVEWHDDLISSAKTQNERDTLLIEKLVYALKIDLLLYAEDTKSKSNDLRNYLRPNYLLAQRLLLDVKRQNSNYLDNLVINELKVAVVEKFPNEIRFDVYKSLAEIAARANLFIESQGYWENAYLVAKDFGDFQRQVEALIGKHNSTWQVNPQDSFSILNTAREICKHSVQQLLPNVLYEMGFACDKAGNLNDAIKFYKEALSEAEQKQDRDNVAKIFNDYGYSLALYGDHGRARVNVEKGLEIRQIRLNELNKSLENLDGQLSLYANDERQIHEWTENRNKLIDDIHTARLFVGMSTNTLGELARYQDDLAKATGHYSEALSIFSNLGDHYWQITTLLSRGETHRRLSMQLFNQHRLDVSSEYFSRATEDVETAMSLCENNGFIEVLDTAYRRLGRLFHDKAIKLYRSRAPQEDVLLALNEAKAKFDFAIRISEDSADEFERLENLTEVAFLVDDMIQLGGGVMPVEWSNHIHNLEEALNELRTRPVRPYTFEVFEHLLELEKAASEFALENLDEAMSLYLKSLVGLARDTGYGSARFRLHRDHFFRNFQSISNIQTQKYWLEKFTYAWNTEFTNQDVTLATAHPDFLERLTTDLGTAFLRS